LIERGDTILNQIDKYCTAEVISDGSIKRVCYSKPMKR